jgi:signal transduction histidine kinase
MTPQRSVRSRMYMGSALWTIGLLGVGTIFSATMAHHFPRAMGQLHFGMLGFFAAILLIAGFTQLRRGLSPFHKLRDELLAVREGRSRQVDGSYPPEVQPLVTDLNQLLDQHEQAVTRARSKAGDLAHGLKTPLAVLQQEADRAAAAGSHELADVIRQQVTRMQRHVDYHLAHARAAASGSTLGTKCSVHESAAALVRTLLRLHADRDLTIDVQPGGVPDVVRVERADLDEMLGNLLDNACKWAKSRITLSSSAAAGSGRVVILIDDDGPGIAASMRTAVLQRGVRADETAPGFGFGLAIVRDLAELYGGTIALSESPMGGVRARLELPTA